MIHFSNESSLEPRLGSSREDSSNLSSSSISGLAKQVVHRTLTEVTRSLSEEKSNWVQNSLAESKNPARRRARTLSFEPSFQPGVKKVSPDMTYEEWNVEFSKKTVLQETPLEGNKKGKRLEFYFPSESKDLQEEEVSEVGWKEAQEKAFERIALQKQNLENWPEYWIRQTAIKSYETYLNNNPSFKEKSPSKVKFEEENPDLK